MISAFSSTTVASHDGNGAATDYSAALLERLRAGDGDAYHELVTACGPRMLATARRLLRSDQDAEDAVQAAFLSAFKALPAFDGRSQLTTWLHRIVVNACLMKLRAKRSRPEIAIEGLLPRFDDDGGRVLDLPAPAPDDASSLAESNQIGAIVRKNIDRLPASYRTVLMLRDIEGVDTLETGKLLGVSANVVKVRLHRARQALRALLVPYVLAAD